MAKVKCEYCGNYIEDTLENCDVCGAINEHHHRAANDTPKTIEELKFWYIARKLPPEETTRFFIGKNIKEPRAFGIYQDGNKFIVYKNKADGSRAVRYKGTDQAYAVNELYMRLKEEILMQKNTNLNRKASASNKSHKNGRVTYTYSKPKRKNGILTLFLLPVLAPFVTILFTCILMFGLFSDLSSLQNSGYYVSDTDKVYYLEDYKGYDDFVWWSYDNETKEWSKFATYKKEQYPKGVTEEDYYDSYYDVSQLLGIDGQDLYIYNSKAFVDAGNHRTPSTSYYIHNDKLYYFLNDSHSSYGNDNTGWYVYENDSWSYYCDEEDKEKLGEELWYSDSEYDVGSDINNIYDYNDSLSNTWNPSSFEDTSWYASYESNNRAYERHQEEIQNNNDNDNWDNDSDYDWDSGDDWDSGSTDWDSDW